MVARRIAMLVTGIALVGSGIWLFSPINQAQPPVMKRGQVSITVKNDIASNELVSNQMILILPFTFLGRDKESDRSYAHRDLAYMGITGWDSPDGEFTIERMPYDDYKVIFVRHQADPKKKAPYAYCPRFENFELKQETLTLVLFRDNYCFDAEEWDEN